MTIDRKQVFIFLIFTGLLWLLISLWLPRTTKTPNELPKEQQQSKQYYIVNCGGDGDGGRTIIARALNSCDRIAFGFDYVRCPNTSSCHYHGSCFLGKCFCDPGWTGDSCETKSTYQPPECSDQNDLCYYHEEYGVPKVTYDRWLRAQSGEYETWVKIWKGATDDRGNEHTVGFGWYAALPFDLGHVIEVGCGPFTQLKNILALHPRNVTSATLVDPLLLYYFRDVPGCFFKNGKFLDIPTTFVQAPAERLRYCETYDTLVMLNVLEHVVDAYVVLENIYDALKPGGYLVLHERTWKYYVPGKRHYRLDDYWRDHPIRIKTPIMEHFIEYFDIIYYTDSSPKWVFVGKQVMHEPDEEGHYIIARKKPVPVIMNMKETGPVPPSFVRMSDSGHQLTIAPSGRPLDVYMVWTREESAFNDWHLSTLESVFLLHPYARITIYSNTLSFKSFERIHSKGFRLSIKPLIVGEFFSDTPLRDWIPANLKSNSKNYHIHLSNVFRIAVLWKYGGWWLDWGVLVLKPLDNFTNAIAFSSGSHLHSGIMTFEKTAPILNLVMQQILKQNPINYECEECFGSLAFDNATDIWRKVWSNYVVTTPSLLNHPSSFVTYPAETFRLLNENEALKNADAEPNGLFVRILTESSAVYFPFLSKSSFPLSSVSSSSILKQIVNLYKLD
jgi:SAM-dependent methyltransferase